MLEDDKGRDESDVPMLAISKTAVRIQSWFRGCVSRERSRELLSRLTKRKRILEELVATEENYIRDLSIMVSDFMNGLEQQHILNIDDIKTIFSNIDELRQLNSLFFATIFNHVEHYSHWRIIFEEVEKEIYFFKLYFEYLNNYTRASAHVTTLITRNNRFTEWFRALRKNPKYKMLTLEDYLVKPLQRLPKYVLLMKEIRKCTPREHPDWNNIERTLLAFERVNKSNNEQLNRVVNRLKLIEIERVLALPQSITEPGMEFVLEEPVTVLTADNQVLECLMYLLSSELLVVRRELSAKNMTERLLVRVPFHSGGSHIMENEDQFYYRNCFTVQNDDGDSCTFLCQNEDDKFLLTQKVLNQIMIAEKLGLAKLEATYGQTEEGEFMRRLRRFDLLPDVTVLGTEERSDTMFKYTIYMVEVRVKSVRQKIFLRFSEILSIQTYIETHFPGVHIKQTLLKTTWVMNHNPKKIEERKMNLQRFLKEILAKEVIIEKGKIVLAKLGLPIDLYALPDKYKEIGDQLKKSSFSQKSQHKSKGSFRNRARGISNFAECRPQGQACNRLSLFRSSMVAVEPNEKQISRRLSIQEVLQANEINLGHYTRFSEVIDLESVGQKESLIKVNVPWLESSDCIKELQLPIKSNQRVLYLISKVSEELNLHYYKDFRLFLEREYAIRQLDDDEIISKVVDEMKDGRYRLLFKKMIYVDGEMEQCELRADKIRLKVVASQVVYEAKKDKFVLSYGKFLTLSVLVGIVKTYAESVPNLVELQELVGKELAMRTREIVANKFTLFYDGLETWRSDYEQTYRCILTKLVEISHENRLSRQSLQQESNHSSSDVSVSELAAEAIVEQMKDDPFFGSVSYVVQISSELRDYLEHDLEEEAGIDNRNCWLIIKHNQISLFSISQRHRIFMFKVEDVHRIEPYPTSIVMHLRGCQVDSIKLKTPSSYAIRELVVYYRNYSSIKRRMMEEGYSEIIGEFVGNWQDKLSCE